MGGGGAGDLTTLLLIEFPWELQTPPHNGGLRSSTEECT